MKKMSHFGMGILLVTLLMLGLSNKGIYGEVPVNFKGVHDYFEPASAADRVRFASPPASVINSLFVKDADSGPTALIILVAHDAELSEAVQSQNRIKQTPLVLSVSTLPFKEVQFDPNGFEFEQGDRVWHPRADSKDEVIALPKNGSFGGLLRDGEIHQGVVMLPEWFDVHSPIIMRYGKSERVLKF